MPFDPRAAAREVLATTNLCDPTDVADKVAEMTSPGDMAGAYRLALRYVAREAIHTARMSAQAPIRAPKRSATVAAVRDHHQSYYDMRVFALGEWKLLGDCRVEDVRDLAAQAQALADANARKAATWTSLADQMEQVGASQVADMGVEALPDMSALAA